MNTRTLFVNNILSPCKDCKDRCVNCHSKCEKYQSFSSERRKTLDNIYSQKEKDRDYFNFKFRTLEKKEYRRF